MATPTELLIPFQGGLDTFSNPQILDNSKQTAALGLMLDRPGAAYPGPGFAPVAWDPASTNVNHGIANLPGGPATNTDQLLMWTTRASGGPGIVTPGSATTAQTLQPLAPWRQSTQRFQEDNTSQSSGNITPMTCAPQSCIVGTRAFYVWTTATQIVMCYQDLNTRLWAGPFILSSTTWTSDSTAITSSAPAQLTVAGDSTYFRLAFRNSTTATMYSWLGSNPLTAALSTVSAPHCTNIESISTGDEYSYGGTCPGVFICTNTLSVTLDLYAFNGSSSSTGVTLQLSVGAVTGAITGTPVRVTGGASNAFLIGIYGGTASLGVFTVTTNAFINSNTTTYTGTIAADTCVAFTLCNLVSGSGATLGVAVEYKPASVTTLGSTFTWDYVAFTTLTQATPAAALTVTTQQGWGGLALLSKAYSWYNGTERRPLVVCRSGWRQTDGTFGSATTAGVQMAYPNAYLYDYTGQLYGKFGDSDVGTDALFFAFNSGSNAAATLNPLPDMFNFTLTSGQQTLTCPWPQVGDALFVSARVADAGSIIGAKAGLATVTWSAPTGAEPAAQTVQFGTSAVIPGTLTAIYDGSSVFEAGFLTRTPTPFIQSVGSGGSLPTGTTYIFKILMVYKDAAGRLHYSAPSQPVSVITTANNDSFNIKIPYVNQTLHNGATPVAFWIYRNCPSTSTPTKSYRLATATAVNKTTATPSNPLTASIQDGTVDATISQYAELMYDSYQTNGVANNASLGTFAPPPFDCVTVWNNQVWGIANRNGPELWCTWPQNFNVFQPEGPAWSPANRIGIPAEVGIPKALIGQDDKLLVFGTRTDCGVIGQPPARSSSIADNPTLFSAAQTLPTPGGIKVLNGVTRLPGGILIQGTQGFTLLDRSLTYQPVGMPVKDFTNTNLYLPGIFLPEQDAVLLFSASDTTKNLCYFYGTGEWTQIEQPPVSNVSTGAASLVVGSVRSVAGQTSTVYVLPSTGNFYATVQAYSAYASYRTPWINLTGKAIGATYKPASSAMLREFHVLGTLPNGFPGNSTLTVVTEYDYSGNTMQPSDTQTLTLTTGSQADLDYQWRFGFSQGNARRVRFTVTVNGGQRVATGNTLPPVLLTGLMLSYDVDAGLSRVGAANSTGT